MRVSPSILVLLLAASAGSAAAQTRRFEIIPEYGYTNGGSRSFDATTVNGKLVPGGKLVLDNSPAYGATFSAEGWGGNFFTFTYMRQDTKLGAQFSSTPPASVVANPNAKGGFSTSEYIVGARHEFASSEQSQIRPYLGFGLGVNVLDPKFSSVGGARVSSGTDMLFSLHGGIKYMLGTEQRVGLMADFRGVWTYVPSGDWTVYCDYWYGCNAFQGTTAMGQSTIKGGLVYKF